MINDAGRMTALTDAGTSKDVVSSSRSGQAAERRASVAQTRGLCLVGGIELVAETDALTGLVNRSGFIAASGTELARVRREGVRLAMAVVAIDDLKQVNDELGHDAGDQVLRYVARTIVGTVRRSDTVARMGGNEFALLLLDANQSGAARASERVRSAIAGRPVMVDGQIVRCTVSTGVVEFDCQHDDIGSSIAMAHDALLGASREGRDRVACAEHEDGPPSRIDQKEIPFTPSCMPARMVASV